MSKLKKAARYGGSFALVVLSTPDLAHALYVCSQCTLSTTSKAMDSQQISPAFLFFVFNASQFTSCALKFILL